MNSNGPSINEPKKDEDLPVLKQDANLPKSTVYRRNIMPRDRKPTKGTKIRGGR